MHFGHCDIYTIVELEDGKVVAQSTLESIPHQQGGCMTMPPHKNQMTLPRQLMVLFIRCS